jgi:methylenetetrahydrofolate reductase (NADPH)
MNLSKLFQSKKVVYSFEVFPPKKTTSIDTIYNTLYGLRGLPADFISVTYGAGGSDTQKNKTCEIASLIKSEYRIEPVSHLTCINSSKEDIIDTLQRLKENGIQNILALRGDKSPTVIPKHDFAHASDLTRFIKEYDSEFNILGACYPECHCDSDTIDEDIENLKKKIDAGASHLITQLFFDNSHFYEFMDKVVQKGITVPISAGIMPIVNQSQIERTVSMCGASLPNRFATMINKYAGDPIALKDAGIAYATEQIVDLITNDTRGIHLYTMNNVEIASRITASIENIIKSNNRSNL